MFDWSGKNQAKSNLAIYVSEDLVHAKSDACGQKKRNIKSIWQKSYVKGLFCFQDHLNKDPSANHVHLNVFRIWFNMEPIKNLTFVCYLVVVWSLSG